MLQIRLILPDGNAHEKSLILLEILLGHHYSARILLRTQKIFRPFERNGFR